MVHRIVSVREADGCRAWRARSRARPGAIQWLILCGAALVIAIALGTGYLALQFRERALEVSERELTNSALLLSRHFDQQLADLQHVHDDVVAHMQAGRVDTAEGFERQMSTLAAHEMLRAKLAALPHVGGLNLFNVKGQLINTSEMWPVADVEYYGPALLSANLPQASLRPT